MNRLTEIANKYNCDKGTVAYEAHGYTEEYGKIIPETGKYNLFEIGIWHGDSLRMWHEYNPELYIDAIDIDVETRKYDKEINNVNVFIADQGNIKELERLSLCTEYDFIVDDGSHRYEDILTSYKVLYPKLKDGGYYFIEDLHAPQAQKYKLLGEIASLYDFTTPGFRCDGKLWIIQKL